MVAILLTAIVVIALIAFGSWMIRALLRYRCPKCEGDDSSILPVVPGLRWYCLGCEEMYSTEDLATKGDTLDNEG